jgi:elongator complex protein 5
MYLATAILRISNLSHTIEKKKARDRSLPEPVFGLEEGKEGFLFGLGRKLGKGEAGDEEGVVVDMEVRRKSGRGVREVFVLGDSSSSATSTMPEGMRKGEAGGKIRLLDDHPLYAPPTAKDDGNQGPGMEGAGDGEIETTFSLGLTEKQRRDREGVVLPYFDAQKGEWGTGEGGRILYEMDRVDDFDEEEDEI